MVSSVNKEKTRHRQVQVKPNGCIHPRYNYNTRPVWKFRSDLCRRCPWKLGLRVSSIYNSDSWAERLKRRENGSLFLKDIEPREKTLSFYGRNLALDPSRLENKDTKMDLQLDLSNVQPLRPIR